MSSTDVVGASDADDAAQACDAGVCGCVYCRIQANGLPDTVGKTTRDQISWEMGMLHRPRSDLFIETRLRVFAGCIKGELALWKGPRQLHCIRHFSLTGKTQRAVLMPSNESVAHLDATSEQTISPYCYVGECGTDGTVTVEFDPVATANRPQAPHELWKGGFWWRNAPCVPWQTVKGESYYS